jgi:hypothetical protein
VNTASLRRLGAVALALAFLAGVQAVSIVRYSHIERGRMWPIVLTSLLVGLLNSLFAVGIVLVYRASRVINFAHGGFFAIAYVIFYGLGV